MKEEFYGYGWMATDIRDINMVANLSNSESFRIGYEADTDTNNNAVVVPSLRCEQ